MHILDKYILKKYFVSFFFTLLILVPVAVAINVSEKIGKFLEHPNLGLKEIVVDYYLSFIINYGTTFMPIALFISTILFTSKMASNTEIVAIHSAGISFKRLLRPYLIGALTLGAFAFLANHFLVPNTNKSYEEFEETYLRRTKKTKTNVSFVNLQLSENDFIYFRNFNLRSNTGFDFSYEHFDGLDLKYKIIGSTVKYNEADSSYSITNYKKRWVRAINDSIETGRKLDTVFDFLPKDLLYVDYLAKEMTSFKLAEHIDQSETRGVKNLNKYKVELYKRSSIPVSSIILTLIAFSLASKKRRGGIGIHLAYGISLMAVYVFFMKVSEVLGARATYNSLIMVWLPNVLFGILAVYLYLNARR